MFGSKFMDDMRPYINYSIIVIVYLAVIGSILVFLTGSHGSIGSRMTNPRIGSIEFASVKKEITPSIDMVLSYGNATFYLPKGATNTAGYLSMILREPNLFPAAGEPGWSRPFAVTVEVQNYQGTPAQGVSFFKTAQICFQVNEKMWRDYTQHPAAYQVEYYAETLAVPHWVTLPMSTDAEQLQLCGETDHLSLFALAINVQPGFTDPLIPITGATPGATPIPTLAPTNPIPTDISPTKEHNKGSLPIIITTPVPPTFAATSIPPTTQPTDIIPTVIPPTDPPTDIAPTNPPPTDVVPTDPPATDPPATEPPATNPPPTDPPATDPPATNPPAVTSAPPAGVPVDTPAG